MVFPGNNKFIINQSVMREMVAYYLKEKVFEDPLNVPEVTQVTYLVADPNKGSFEVALSDQLNDKKG